IAPACAHRFHSYPGEERPTWPRMSSASFGSRTAAARTIPAFMSGSAPGNSVYDVSANAMATASGSLVSMVDASSAGKDDGITFVGGVLVGCGAGWSLDEE